MVEFDQIFELLVYKRHARDTSSNAWVTPDHEPTTTCKSVESGEIDTSSYTRLGDQQEQS